MSEPFAELLVDSARALAGPGRRGAAVADRQLVYRHEGLQVELLVQCASPSAAFVWGQLCRTGSGEPCEGASVSWLDTVPANGTSATDAFGEFSLAAPASGLGVLAIDAAEARFLCRIAPPSDAPAARPSEGRTA